MGAHIYTENSYFLLNSNNSYALHWINDNKSYPHVLIIGKNHFYTTMLIEESTDMETFLPWLNSELDTLMEFIESYKDTDTMIDTLIAKHKAAVKKLHESTKLHPDTLSGLYPSNEYGLLLKESNRKTEYNEWLQDEYAKIETGKAEIEKFSQKMDAVFHSLRGSEYAGIIKEKRSLEPESYKTLERFAESYGLGKIY